MDERQKREDRVLADIVKSTHKHLRERVMKNPEKEEWIWEDHVRSSNTEYAKAMKKLSEDYWTNESRLKWIHSKLNLYFDESNDRNRFFLRLQKKIGNQSFLFKDNESFAQCRNRDEEKPVIKVLDVGSCHNPLSKYLLQHQDESYKITAIDLCPATKEVFKCDFINVDTHFSTTEIGDDIVDGTELKSIAEDSYDAVIFSLLLEYLPTPSLRLKAVKKAIKVLAYGGLLIIVTPDSNPENKNQPQMKAWRLAMAYLGLVRIYIEKLKHVHCLAFVKVPLPDYEKAVEQEINTIRKKYTPDASFQLATAFYIPQDSF